MSAADDVDGRGGDGQRVESGHGAKPRGRALAQHAERHLTATTTITRASQRSTT